MDSSKKYYDSFCHLWSESKTLRFALEPEPKTKKWLEEKDKEFRDMERHQAYPLVKEVLDRYHRQLISCGLESEEKEAVIDWSILGELLEEEEAAEAEDKKDIRKKVKAEQERIRTYIAEIFSTDKKVLFGKNPFGAKGFLLQQNLTEEERKAIEVFDKFSVYFGAYDKSRENLYSAKDISVSVANRIVNENFTRHFYNLKNYKRVKGEAPELIEKIRSRIASEEEGFQEELFLQYNGFRQALSQKGIDRYNFIVGIYNSEVNEYRMKKENLQSVVFQKQKNCMLRGLYKQILSVSEKRFVFEQYGTDEEVLKDLQDMVYKEGEMKVEETLDKIRELFFNIDSYDMGGIYIKTKSLTELSLFLCKTWDLLNNALHMWYSEELSKRYTGTKLHDEIEKRVNKEYVSLKDIFAALRFYCANVSEDVDENSKIYRLSDLLENVNHLLEELSQKKEQLCKFLKIFSFERSLKEEEVPEIKEYLDAWLHIVHFAKWFELKDAENICNDGEFYLILEEILYDLKDIVTVYNKVRNYITQKPYKEEKIRLKFNNPTIADGWSSSKEQEYGSILLRKGGQYYLGVFNPFDKPTIQTENDLTGNYYEKMEYLLMKDISQMLPKCTTQLKEVKAHFLRGSEDFLLNTKKFFKPLRITKEIYDLNNVSYDGKKKWQKDYLKTGDEQGYRDAVLKWNTFCIQFLQSYKTTMGYDYSVLRPVAEYQTVDELYNELNNLLYKVQFLKVDVKQIAQLEEEGKLFLFRITNKDFEPGKKEGSKKNLHTLYWEALFSEENAVQNIIKLNGGAELFLRPASIKNPVVHKAGEVLLNKRVEAVNAEGETYYKPIPEEIYRQLKQYYNQKITREELSLEAQEFMGQHEIRTSVRKYDIVKDRRYTKDKYFLHVPITINYRAGSGNKFRLNVLKELQKCRNVNVIGLDRGERNLIAYSVVNAQGIIMEQGSFNIVEGMDYHAKLSQLEAARKEERKNWKKIENIKELKQGYISQVIHQITQLIEKYNAIVVMEDLNYGFKKGRYKVEKQVYQKFETALIRKLSYMVTRKTEGTDMLLPGGVLNGYQLAMLPESVKNAERQCGAIFYVPAGYTSKIDPTTGFVDVFNYSKLSDREKRKQFFTKFDDIFYDERKDCFAFHFNYRNFEVYQEVARTEWTVYTNTVKHVYSKEERKNYLIEPTRELKKLFVENGIDYQRGNLKESIQSLASDIEHAGFWKQLEYLFQVAMRLRDSDNSERVIDRILSPVINAKGEFFMTPDVPSEKNRYDSMPMDADTNGAYHIALKGLFLLNKKIREAELTDKIPKDLFKITNAEWFAYVQEEIHG